MKSYKETSYIFEDVCVNVKILIAALWTAMMFLYMHLDHFKLFELASIPVTQEWLFAAMALMTIPTLMIFLSLALKANVNRVLNIIICSVYIVVVIINAIGVSWLFYTFGSIVEVVLLLLIVRFAWTWPKEVA